MQTQHKVLFKASLSNGQTVYEGKGDYKRLPGLSSPWERLQTYILKNDLVITSLSLYTASNQNFNLPSAGKNPKFHLFESAPKPQKYNFFRQAGQNMNESNWEIFAVIEADYGDNKAQLWVSNEYPKNCWVTLVEGSHDTN